MWLVEPSLFIFDVTADGGGGGGGGVGGGGEGGGQHSLHAPDFIVMKVSLQKTGPGHFKVDLKR